MLAVATVAGFVLALGGEDFLKNYATLVIVHAVYIILIGYLIWLVFDVRTGRFKLPEVAKVIQEDLILLCRPIDWIGMGAAVSVYRSDGDYEQLVGPAEVINIQQNGFSQVKILSDFASDEERQRASEELGRIDRASFVIKPSGLKGEW